MNKSIIVISGPTASGKSDLAVKIAKQINGEIISADSVAVYKGFEIGSAAPCAEHCAKVPHHLIAELDATEEFNAGIFKKSADEKISNILERGRTPIIVGGTGLYIRALINGLVIDSKEVDDAHYSHSDLAAIDSKSAAMIHPNDNARIKRAVEYANRTGGSITELREEHQSGEPEYRALIILISADRNELYSRINERSKRMIDEGLVDETENLLKKYPKTAKPFSAIGYRHVLEYLERKTSTLDQLVELLSRDTRRFAKRQLTWWKNQPKKLGWSEFSRNVDDALDAFLEQKGDLGKDGVFVISESV